MELIDIFRLNIKFYRFSRNLSQEKLGEICGLSTHYISDIENGKYSPSIPTIQKIAKALNIQASLFFTENPKAKELASRVDIQRKKSA